MTAHNIILDCCLQELLNQRDPVKSEAGYNCPKCGRPFLVSYGRRSRRFLAWHSISPRCADGGRFLTNMAMSEEQAVEVCRIASES